MTAIRANLFENYGCLVSAADSQPALTDIDPQLVYGLLKEHGVVVLRGFRGDIETFKRFSDGFSSDFLVHPNSPARVPLMAHDRTIASVQTSNAALFLHGEMHYLPVPLRPDVVWFYCYEAPAQGGETTFCEGANFLAALRPATQQIFKDQKVIYRHTLPKSVWNGPIPIEDTAAAIHALRARFQIESDIKLLENGHVLFDVATPVIYRHPHTGKEVFIQSISNILQNNVGRIGAVLLENEEPIAQELLDEIRETGERLANLHRWCTGDLVLADNTRVLHGRRAFTGPRAIATRFSRGWDRLRGGPE